MISEHRTYYQLFVISFFSSLNFEFEILCINTTLVFSQSINNHIAMNTTQLAPTNSSQIVELSTETIGYSIALCFIIILALIGNIVVCLAFYRSSSFRTPTVMFIVSLAVTDILVASVSIPLWLSIQLSLCSSIPCNLAWKVIDVLFSTASIMNLCAISIDRFVIIAKPLTYPYNMTMKRAYVALVAIWVYAFTLAAIVFSKWKYYPTFVFVVDFIIPLTIMVTCYSLIFKTALSQVRRVFPIRQAYYFKREFKAAKTLGIVMGTFLACWAPFFLLNLIVSYRELSLTPGTIAGVKILHYINSALNPLIYSCSNKEFRFKILRVLPCSCGRVRHPHMIDRVVFWSTTLTPNSVNGNGFRQESMRIRKN